MSRKQLLFSLSLLMISSPSWAAGFEGWRPGSFLMSVGSTIAFALIGILMAIASVKLFDLATPFSLEKEICEKQNIAAAILTGAFVLGVCIIVALAVI